MESLVKGVISLLAWGILLMFPAGALQFGTAVDGIFPLALLISSTILFVIPCRLNMKRLGGQFGGLWPLGAFLLALPASYISLGSIGAMNWTRECALATLLPIYAGALWGGAESRRSEDTPKS